MIVSTRIFTEPAGLVESRSWNEKKSVPERSTICCTGVYVGWSIPHSYDDILTTQATHGTRAATLAPHRISFVLLL